MARDLRGYAVLLAVCLLAFAALAMWGQLIPP
jgi:hypothetical protein